MYTRYVDDIFLLFSDLQHLDLFKNFMNTRHTNIKFTSEVEKDNQLAFLDVNITKHNRAFKTGIYRKPTFSGIYTNFNSLIPDEYKTGLVTTLLERCFQISSNYETIHKEIEKLKSILLKNAYPIHFLDKTTKH